MSRQRSMTLDLFESFAQPQPPAPRATTDAQNIAMRVGLTRAAPQEMQPIVRQVLGEAACSAFESEFHLIEIAEQTIKRFVNRYPSHASMLNQAFLALQWHLRKPVRDELYRAHVQELLQRVVEHKRLDEGTRAEALVAISDTSLRAPLAYQFAAVAEKLFLEIFGPDAIGGPEQPMYPEPWPEALEESLNELRRKIRVPSRQLTQRKPS